jgi:hypothetical protein
MVGQEARRRSTQSATAAMPDIQPVQNSQAPTMSSGQCTPSQIRVQPTVPAYNATAAQAAMRPERRSRCRTNAQPNAPAPR